MIKKIQFFALLIISTLGVTQLSSAIVAIRVRGTDAGLEIFHQNQWKGPNAIFGDPHENVLKNIVPDNNDRAWLVCPEDASVVGKTGDEWLWPLYATPMGGNIDDFKKDQNIRYESSADSSKFTVKSFTYGIDFTLLEALNIPDINVGSVATIRIKREGSELKIYDGGTWKTFNALGGSDIHPNAVKKIYLKSNPSQAIREDDVSMYEDGEEILWVIETKPTGNMIYTYPETFEFAYESTEDSSKTTTIPLKRDETVSVSITSAQVNHFIGRRDAYNSKVGAEKAAAAEAARKAEEEKNNLNASAKSQGNDGNHLHVNNKGTSRSYSGRYRNLDKDWLGRQWQRYMAFRMRRRSNRLELLNEGSGWVSVDEFFGDPESGYYKKLFVEGDEGNYLLQTDWEKFNENEEFFWIVNANKASYKSGDEHKLRLVFKSITGRKQSVRDARAIIHDNLDNNNIKATQFQDLRSIIRF